MKFGRTSDVKS